MAYGDSTTIQDLNAVAFNHIVSDPRILNAAMRGRNALALLLGTAGAEGYRLNELRREFGFDKVQKDHGASIEVTMFSGTASFRNLTLDSATDPTPPGTAAKPIAVTLPWREVIGNVDVPGQYMRRAAGDARKIENVMRLFGSQLVQGWLEKLHSELMSYQLPTSTTLGGLYGLISDGKSAGETPYRMYGQLDRGADDNQEFRSLVVDAAATGSSMFSRGRLAGWQQQLRDRGGNARIGILNSIEHATLQVQYDGYVAKDEYSDLMSKVGAPYFEDNGTLFIPDSKAPQGTLLLFDPEDFFVRGRSYDAMPNTPQQLQQEATFVHLQDREDDWRGKIIHSLQIGAHGNAFKHSAKIKNLTFA